jgi:hypothetical protein
MAEKRKKTIVAYMGQFQSLGPKRPGGPPGPRPPLLPASGGPRPRPRPPPMPPPPPPAFPAGRPVPHRLQTPRNAKLMLPQLHPQVHISASHNKRADSSNG